MNLIEKHKSIIEQSGLNENEIDALDTMLSVLGIASKHWQDREGYKSLLKCAIKIYQAELEQENEN